MKVWDSSIKTLQMQKKGATEREGKKTKQKNQTKTKLKLASLFWVIPADGIALYTNFSYCSQVEMF